MFVCVCAHTCVCVRSRGWCLADPTLIRWVRWFDSIREYGPLVSMAARPGVVRQVDVRVVRGSVCVRVGEAEAEAQALEV